MLRKTPAIILAVMLCLLCLHPLAAAAQTGPSADDAQGAWHLVEIVDYENKEAAQKKDGEMQYDFRYARRQFQGKKSITIGQYDNIFGAKASWSEPPDVIRGGEMVTLQGEIAVTEDTYCVNIGGQASSRVLFTNPDWGPTSYVPLAGFYKQDDTLDGLYVSSEGILTEAGTFTAEAPRGREDGERIALRFLFSFSGEYMATDYVYEWRGASATAAPTPAPGAEAMELRGLVRSVENKPMPWMKLDAYVYYGQEQYDGSRQPDAIVESAADHEGRFCIPIDLGENITEPVGILLVGTLKCVVPYDGGYDAFYFVDMQDAFSRDNNQVSLSTWIAVNPADYPDATADQPLAVYRLLAFYHLGLDAWSFDIAPGRLMPDPVHHFSADPRQAGLLENYSALYTAACDAWLFGGVILNEAKSLSGAPVRIETRWTGAEAGGSSHFSGDDMCIRLSPTQSLRDDGSRYTVLHEFGHAFDYITNGNQLRAYAPYGPGNIPHGGYMNDSTSDSYIEGFATFYAGIVQDYRSYPNPRSLSFIELTDPGRYTVWGYGGKDEELAIATLLYNTHHLMNLSGASVRDYWSVLKADRADFYEYYTAIEAYLAAKSPRAARKLRQYALDSGLYRMPFGNGRYDPGEPFRDLPGGVDGQYDANELFADLMFGVDANSGWIDPARPLQAYDESALVAGQSSDASRQRKTIQPPASGYLYLSGEVTEYLLVDILPAGETGSRTLRATDGGRVLIGLPSQALKGKVRVSVPGGRIVYEGDLAALQRRQAENAGLAVPLDEARISAADLAPSGTAAIAAYGDVKASGVLAIPQMSRAELIRLADAYAGDASPEEVAAALVARPDDGERGFPTWVVIGVAAFVLLGGTLAVILVIRGKRKNAPAAPARTFGQPPTQPPPSPKSRLGLVAAITAAAVVAICAGSYFLFFAGEGTHTALQGPPAAASPAPAAVLPQQPTLTPGTEQASPLPEPIPSPPEPTPSSPEPLPSTTPETVAGQTVRVSIAYDSGEGVYTGEVKDGVPHGRGSFEMQKSDTGRLWSYEGQWENGAVTGEGVMHDGGYVYTGTFRDGLLHGLCKIEDNGTLRYTGMCRDGLLHGEGTLYTKGGGMLLFEGTFENDMLLESEADRKKRGETFKAECVPVDEPLYWACVDEDGALPYLVKVWGFPVAMGEQRASGTIIIGHFGMEEYPVCLLHRYSVGEPKMASTDWINAWGVVGGMYEYKDRDGNTISCLMVEVVYWDNEPEVS